MAAQFIRRHRRDEPLSHRGSPFHTVPTSSQIYHLNRPHTTKELNSNPNPVEMVILLMALLALLALIVWLAWIGLRHCINYVQGTIDDLNFGKQTKKNVKRAEEVPKKMFAVGWDLGRAAKGCLDGFLRAERGEMATERERRALLREIGGREVYTHGYRYDRERYGDGTSDSVSTRKTIVRVDHREDCEEQCGSTPRRWSVDM